MFFRKEERHECGDTNHCFEGRYDYEDSKNEFGTENLSVEELEVIIEFSRRGKYVLDICHFCGKVVKFVERETE